MGGDPTGHALVQIHALIIQTHLISTGDSFRA